MKVIVHGKSKWQCTTGDRNSEGNPNPAIPRLKEIVEEGCGLALELIVGYWGVK